MAITQRFGDAETIQSTGAFLQGELERLDPVLKEPITDFTWSRDVPVRTDATIADEVTSFITATYAGGFGGTGNGEKNWITGKDTVPARVTVGATKKITPLTPWGAEVSYSIFDLQKAQQVGRPIDRQQVDALHIKWQLDCDRQAYLGDEEVGIKGLLNSAEPTRANVGTLSATPTVSEVTGMVDAILNTAWENTQYTRIPNVLLIAPALFAKLASTQLTNTPMNLLNYVKANNLSVANGGSLDIRPVKYLGDSKLFSTPRVVAYTQDRDVVRFPLVNLQSLPIQYRDFSQSVPYYGALGGIEFVRPEMVFYGDLAS